MNRIKSYIRSTYKSITNNKNKNNQVGIDEENENNDNNDEQQEPLDEKYTKSRFEDPSPEDNANIFSRVSFHWAQHTVDRGIRKTLELSDIPLLPESLQVGSVVDPMLYEIDFNSKYPILKSCYKDYVFRNKILILIRIIAVLGSLATPLLLKLFILYIQNKNDYPAYRGWLLCLGLFLSSVCYSIGSQNGYWYGLKVCLITKSSLVSAIFRKMLRLNNTSKREYAGKVLNLVSVDVENFVDFFWNNCIDIVLHPIQIILLLAMLCYFIGLAGFVGFLVMAFMLPISTFVSTKVTKYFIISLNFSDERVKLVGEFISGIRFLKLYNWEKSFIDRIMKLRVKQLDAQWKKLMFWAIDQTVVQMCNGLVLFVALLVYTLLGNELTPSTAFTALSIFLLLREPVNKLSESFQRILKVVKSSRRIEQFLLSPESKSYQQQQQSVNQPNNIILTSNNSTNNANGNGTNIINNGEFKIIDGEFDWDDSFQSDEELVDVDLVSTTDKKEQLENDDEDEYDQDDDGIQLTKADMVGLVDRSTSRQRNSVLKNINFIAPAGKLTMIVGRVGEGKTSLVAALIGEICHVSGNISVPKSIGYTPQVPWLVSGSLRDNICFGRPFDKDLYIRVIEACCLKPDLVQFPAKDLTELGERGINMSGGQKQRVSLARCLYSNADAFVMDEALSAVDAEVAKHLFDHCIQGMMGDRTRILVTHQLQFLPFADHIIVVEKGQLIQGTYQQLKDQGIDFESIMKTKQLNLEGNDESNASSTSVDQSQQSTSTTSTPTTTTSPLKQSNGASNNNSGGVLKSSTGQLKTQLKSSTNQLKQSNNQLKLSTGDSHYQEKYIDIKDCVSFDEDQNELKVKAKLFVKEESKKGKISKDIYLNYFKSGGSTLLYIMIFIVYFTSQATWQASDYWLVIWSNHVIHPDPGPKFFLLIYLGFLVTFGLLLTLRHILIVNMSWSASKLLHNRLLNSVFFSPCSFFDQNPAGRILNRFSKDISDIDDQLISAISDLLYCGSNVIVSILIMIYVNPFIILPFIILLFFYNYIQKMYRSSSRELKRMESISRSPVYSHLTETFNGLTSVRAFNQQVRFFKEMEKRIDMNQRIFYHSFSVNRWLGVRLEMLSSSMVLLSSIFSMVSANSNPGMAGMAVSAALGLTGILNWAIRQFTELEVKMNSVERVLEYVNAPAEGVREVEHNRPPPEWPQHGRIEFDQLEVRYRPTMPPALRGISLCIEPGHKLGIVGRTGSGKSTLAITLFRMLEASSGCIRIDGIDISTIGLSDLRSKLGVVPQDSFIFSGSVRLNLDPFGQHDDVALWDSLEKTHIKHVVQAMPGGLDGEIDEGGDGFSVGQKQLLCLSRALLRDAKIVLMDEATASLDYESDALIKEVIRLNFKHCTVLTIAHRLDTIIDSDRVLVIDAGRVLEYDTPQALIQAPRSKFSQLVRAQSSVLLATPQNVMSTPPITPPIIDQSLTSNNTIAIAQHS